tara:strand:- start:43 stop:732 length:690 start_codon:yes stop_codon:yes gene_type:complete
MSSTNKILVTGVKSGLGKYIYENISNSVGLTRENKQDVLKGEYDLIVHCAFHSDRDNNIDDYYDYIDSNILLTNELVKLKHKRFVYISSLAVYDKDYSAYKHTKLCSEAIVNKKANNPLIMRVPAMLGVDIRPNTIFRILKEHKPKLTLSEESTFNYVLHSDVKNFVLLNESNGVVDFVSNGNVTLKKVNEILNGNAVFGNYKFITPEIKDGVNWKSSEQVINEYKELV